MKFIYDAALTKSVVQRYFKKYEDIDGELEIRSGTRKIPMCGRSFVEHEVPYVSFRLKGTMEVEGTKQPVELAVSEGEINTAFTTMIEATGRKVKRITMDYDESGFHYIAVEAVAKRKVK